MRSPTNRTFSPLIRPHMPALPAVVWWPLFSLAEGAVIGSFVVLLDVGPRSPADRSVGWAAVCRRLQPDVLLWQGVPTIGLIALMSALLFFCVGLAAQVPAGIYHATSSALIRQLPNVGYIVSACDDPDRLPEDIRAEGVNRRCGCDHLPRWWVSWLTWRSAVGKVR
jgi:hypothetical protein